jgi:hypothetical protein
LQDNQIGALNLSLVNGAVDGQVIARTGWYLAFGDRQNRILVVARVAALQISDTRARWRPG